MALFFEEGLASPAGAPWSVALIQAVLLRNTSTLLGTLSNLDSLRMQTPTIYSGVQRVRTARQPERAQRRGRLPGAPPRARYGPGPPFVIFWHHHCAHPQEPPSCPVVHALVHCAAALQAQSS